MLYLAFAFNVLVRAAFVFALHQGRKERQALALLIKSRDVAEFVRAERHLTAPVAAAGEPDDLIVDLDQADPAKVLEALNDKP